MKSFALVCGVLLVPSFASADPQSLPLFQGVEYRQIVRTEPSPMVAHIISLDLTKPGIRFGVTPADQIGGMEHTAQKVSDYLIASKAKVAINGSYFLPFNGGSQGGEDFYPKAGQPVQVSGAALSDGKVVSPIEIDQDLRINSIVCFKVTAVSIQDGQICPTGTRDAIAAGPRLLSDGKLSVLPPFDFSKPNARGPRTAIGLSADRRTAFLIVVDGRQAGYSMGASLEELAALFQSLGATDAINLDGGGSSALAIADPNGGAKLLSRPIHTGVPGRERPVANHIAIYANALLAEAR
jgi:hypothetical protein